MPDREHGRVILRLFEEFLGNPPQLMHAGAISQGNRFRDTTIGPSAVQPKGHQMEFYYGKGAYPMVRE